MPQGSILPRPDASKGQEKGNAPKSCAQTQAKAYGFRFLKRVRVASDPPGAAGAELSEPIACK
jgi:hypothetical protein